MPPTSRRHLLATSAILLGALAATSLAGELDPPAGPVSPTMKTQVETEPRVIINATNTPGDADSTFKITAPGSYYLTDNITGEPAKHGIEIAADDVSIDLMGFQLIGVTGSLHGIHVSAPFTFGGPAIRNGSIENWGSDGVHLNLAFRCHLTDVRASGNNNGFFLGEGAVVTRCMAIQNNNGFFLNFACVLSECVATLSTNHGFLSGAGCILTSCAATGCGQTGFSVNDGNLISNCVATDNGTSGIGIAHESTVSGCTVSGNNDHGILANHSCVITNNQASTNGGAGIIVFSDGSRIESNHCRNNDVGIDIDGEANYILRNTCIDNTTNNFDIVTDNRFGEIVNHTISSTAPASGNSAPGNVGTTDPWANFAGATPP